MTYTPVHRSVLFGTESGVGLDSRGKDLPMFDVEPKYMGYDVPKAFYPYDRPSTINAELYDNATFPALKSPKKNKKFTRPTTMSKPSRSVRQEDGDYAPLRADIITPSAILKYKDDRPYIMPPNQLLRVLTSSQMPLSLPKSRQSSSRSVHRGKNRLEKMPFFEYRDVKAEMTSPVLRPISRSEEMEEERKRSRGFGPDVVVPVTFDPKSSENQNEQAIVPFEEQPSPVRTMVEYENEYSDSPEYKRARLMEILTLQVSSVTTKEVEIVAKQQHEATMTVLGHDLYDAQEGERFWAGRVNDTVAASINTLPLPFLFQQTGGPGYCRERMQRAMQLWIEEFERNQQRRAWTQWKAMVELFRYNQRSQEYFRQAGIRRMKNAIQKVLNAQKAKGFNKWTDTIRLMIWTARDSSVRKIQRQMRRILGLNRILRLHDQGHVNGPLCDIKLEPCRHLRFQLPVRIRQERREIWWACVAVQMPYRYRRFRQFMRRKRKAATKIQALGRMRLEKNRYLDIRGKIIFTQALIRMYIHRKGYLLFRASTVLIQNNYRGMKGRKLFRSILQVRRRDREEKLSAAATIQRVWRGHEARCRKRAIIKQNNDEFWAALVFQRCWYSYNNEWVTFLLLGCLRERDREEKEWEKQVNAYARKSKALVIQRHFRAYVERRREYFTLVLQCTWRCFLARRVRHILRAKLIASRKLHWWARVHMARRGRIASRLQFWSLRSVPGRFLNHLVIVANQAARQEEIDNHRRCYLAAARIQAMVHGAWTRDYVRHLRASICIQRHIRGYLGRKYAKAIWTALRTEAATVYITELSKDTYDKEVDRRVRLNESSARAIQRFYRGWHCRNQLVRNWVYKDSLTHMAIRIQLLWRSTASLRALRRLLKAHRRRTSNPYQNETDIERILEDSLEKSKRWYDPYDSEAGMGLATWLHRLALDTVIQKFYSKGISKLQQLRGLTEKELKSDYLVPKDACGRILAKLNAKRWIQDAVEKREKHEIICERVEKIQKPLKSARFAFKRASERREKLETEFDDISQECSEFRRPPKSLRRKLDRLTEELEQLDLKNETTQLELESLESVMANLVMQKTASEEQVKEAEAKELKAVYLNRSFEFLDKAQHKKYFLKHFPDHQLKAEAFEKSLKTKRLTSLQLERYFAENTSSSMAKNNVGKLKSFPKQPEMTQWDTKRRLECCDILQYAAERTADVISCDIKVDIADIDNPIHQMVVKARKNAASTLLPGRPRVWRVCVDELYGLETKAKAVQRAWRNRTMRMLQSSIKQKKKIDALTKLYQQESQANKVKEAWEAERAKEAEQYKEWMKEQEEVALLEELQYITRFPWAEYWDDENQCPYYYHYRTKEMVWERPIYTIEEEKAVRRIQPILRGGLGRKDVRKRRRKLEVAQLKIQEEKIWMSKAEERARWITIRLEVRKSPDADREAGIAKWRRLNSSHYGQPMKHQSRSKSELDKYYFNFQQNYHKSVLEARRKVNRKKNADADCLVEMLAAYDGYKHVTRPLFHSVAKIELTKVAVPFEWSELIDEETGRTYYYNYSTDQVVWDRPTYTFEHEYAAKKLQSIYRMRLGMKEFRRTLNKVALDIAVRRTIDTIEKLGWIGFGFEGLSTEMFLYRCGFPNAVEKLQHLSIEELRMQTKPDLRAAGIVHEPDVRLIHDGICKTKQKAPKSHLWQTFEPGHPISIIFAQERAVKMLTLAYPNQQGRISSILDEMLTSRTPISNGLLRYHLSKYEAKPKLALEHLDEIMNQNICSSPEQERQIFHILLRDAERFAIYVANWKITTLRDHLDVAISIASCHVDGYEDLTDYEIQTLDQVQLVKGLWQNDFATTRRVSISQACLVLRQNALERILIWIHAATVAQSAYRTFVMRRWYQTYKQYRSDCTLMIQLCWKQYKARVALAMCRLQYASDYEQLWNDELEAYYYFYHPTEESLWEPPRDEYGQYIPFRPLVKDRRSGNLIKAWPSLDGSIAGKGAQVEEGEAVAMALCSTCKAQEASKVCDYCFSETGEYMYSCFACFALAHNGRDDMKWHTYQPLNKVVADALTCIECRHLATRECLQCEDSYCDKCYERIHRRGNRAGHEYEFFAPGCVVCIECEKTPALSTCESCQDSMCHKCREETHAKGNKKKHKWIEIVQELQPEQEYCQQCVCRPVIKACDCCEMKLCQHCLHREHAEICPDFAVQVKMKEVYANHMCVECGKPADRKCDTCGDKYCSIVWMGNPGCFERFHSKGNRMEHDFTRFRAEEKPAELKELEKKAEEALKEKKRLEARFEQEEKERLEREKLELEKAKDRGEAKMDKFVVGQCQASACVEQGYEKYSFCLVHLTPQNVLSFVADPIRAAKIVTDAQVELRKRTDEAAGIKKPEPVVSRKKSIKKLKKLGKSVHDIIKYR